MMDFEILDNIRWIENIVSDGGIRELKRLNRIYGKANWRKRKGIWSKAVKNKFLLCVDNKGYEAALEIRKVYENIPDKEAENHGQVRIIDESETDYLYPARYFAPIRLMAETKNKIIDKV